MPSGGLNFVIALAGCMTFFGCLLAGSVILRRQDPASIPRYLRWLAAERPEVVLEQDLAWTDSRGVKRRGGKGLVVPEIYEVEIREKVESTRLESSGLSRCWEEQRWMPIAARLAPLSPSSSSPSYPPAKSSTGKPSRPLLPPTSITSSHDASPRAPRPTLLVAFLISPPLPPPSTTIAFSQGEEPVVDFDFEIGVEQVRLDGKVEELKSKSTWT